MRVYFTETQRFNQPWIIIILILGLGSALVLVGYGMFSQLISGEPWGDKPMSDTGIILVFLGTLAVSGFITGLLFSLVLITEVNQEGLRFRFPPLKSRWTQYAKSDILKYEIRKYKPIMEYGGWGIRASMGRGTAYNVRGNIGMQLHLKGGKKVLIGTQKSNQFQAAMNKVFKESEDEQY